MKRSIKDQHAFQQRTISSMHDAISSIAPSKDTVTKTSKTRGHAYVMLKILSPNLNLKELLPIRHQRANNADLAMTLRTKTARSSTAMHRHPCYK
jgi:hypothetical protein